MENGNSARLRLMASMFIFGTIGIFVKYIPLPSSVIACARGLIGSAFLVLLCVALRKKPDFAVLKKSLLLLVVSGGLIGFNWILLFEAYNHTTVAVATLCYYLAPVFVIVGSAFIFKERLTVKKALCVLVALVGMVFVSGVVQGGLPAAGELTGILMGVLAGLLYASVVLINKKLGHVPAYDKTITQLFSAAVVITPYILVTVDFGTLSMTWLTALLLVGVGIVHTGFAYAMYFGSIGGLKAHTVAILSYVDPVVAIVLSMLILGESMDVWSWIGAVLILGSAFISEMPGRKTE